MNASQAGLVLINTDDAEAAELARSAGVLAELVPAAQLPAKDSGGTVRIAFAKVDGREHLFAAWRGFPQARDNGVIAVTGPAPWLHFLAGTILKGCNP